MEQKTHWETVYETKTPNEVSWTQAIPQTSLTFIESFQVSKQAEIIDIGGGDSQLVDYLLNQGYENITVLDISEKALQKAKTRLGEKANLVTWIVSDINDFKPSKNYDVWHDRAAFHFLTKPNETASYVQTVNQFVTGYVCMGTFSEQGPKKCSGLEIMPQSELSLSNIFAQSFEKTTCLTENHKTPFNTLQYFVFCGFKKRMA